MKPQQASIGRRPRAISIAHCVVLLAAALPAQTQQSTPKVPAIAADSSPSQSPGYRLAVQVRRVVVDVVVTDTNGNPLQNLKQNDFKLTEDGVVQQIRTMDAHSGDSTSVARDPPELNLGPDTFSNILPPSDRPATILLLDMLHTPQQTMPAAYKALQKFIEDRSTNTQLAIFVLTDRLHMLQGLTDDEEQLKRAVHSSKASQHVQNLRVAPAPEGADENILGLYLQDLIHQAVKRNDVTAQAFIQIARFASAIPGRKNLVWISAYFQPELFIEPSFGPVVPFDSAVREAKNLLKDSRVAVYPVDVRGLVGNPDLNPSSNHLGPMPPQFMPMFGEALASGHATMDAIAESTGGRAFYNTNGLEQAMDAAVRQGSGYYTLTYAPTNAKADGRERKIKLTLKYPGYQLSYRRTYLADDAKHPTSAQPLTLDVSMQHGAPSSSELFFKAKISPVGGPMPASPQEAQTLRTFAPKDAKVIRTKLRSPPAKIQHYDINFAVLGRQLEMPPAQNGRYSTNMLFALAAYNAEGSLLNELEVRVKNDIPEDRYRKIASEGYHASMLFAVPEGALSLRMAVRDEISKRIGTLEIPLPIPTTEDRVPHP